jgi:hypothetical protein
VALAEDEAVALLPLGACGVDTQDAVVQDVEHVERRGRALGVLLVTGLERHQLPQLGDPFHR